MRHRLLVASLLLLLALTFVVLPAYGKPPPAAVTATVTFTDNGDCTVTVTYTWSGFKGTDLRAQYGVLWPVGAGAEIWILSEAFHVTGSGTASDTFDLTGYGSHTYQGLGRLRTTRFKTLSGSDVRSATSANLNC